MTRALAETDQRTQQLLDHRAHVLSEANRVIRDALDPVSQRYNYRTQSLAKEIQGQPLVLLIGNYSSGKSTFVNEYLGVRVQQVGQAPVDDSFTVILYDSETEGSVEEKVGLAVVDDPALPFSSMREFGNGFLSHLRLKRINNPSLQYFGLIDSPGMLDTNSDVAGRSYNYGEVVAEFARFADIVLVLFDCHRPGTIAETHQVLQNHVIPAVGEGKLIYIFNRIDEVESVEDLARAYGVLCWNLSQITRRKEVPHIYFTYSEMEAERRGNLSKDFDLKTFSGKREDLLNLVKTAPKRRADNIVNHLVEQTERLRLFLQALHTAWSGYRKRRSKLRRTLLFSALLLLVILAAAVETWQPGFWLGMVRKPGEGIEDIPLGPAILVLLGAAAGLFLVFKGFSRLYSTSLRRIAGELLDQPDQLVQLRNDGDRQRWEQIRLKAIDALHTQGLSHSPRTVARDLRTLEQCLSEYSSMRQVRRSSED